MKIDRSVSTPGLATTPASTAKASAATPQATAGQGASQVQLSPQATALLSAQAVSQDSAVFDSQRVAEIKQAIAQGQFSINPEKIADGLLGNVQQMLQNKNSH